MAHSLVALEPLYSHCQQRAVANGWTKEGPDPDNVPRRNVEIPEADAYVSPLPATAFDLTHVRFQDELPG